MCERCFDEYDEGEIYPSEYFNKLFCIPCEKEYEIKFRMFRTEFMNNQPERSKREDYKITTINSYECPKIEMQIDKDILTKYKLDSIDAVL